MRNLAECPGERLLGLGNHDRDLPALGRILRELIELAERDADAELVDALHDALHDALRCGDADVVER